MELHIKWLISYFSTLFSFFHSFNFLKQMFKESLGKKGFGAHLQRSTTYLKIYRVFEIEIVDVIISIRETNL